MSTEELVQGWVSPPNSRGTFDILWSCLQTTILCAWTSICTNVPSPDDGPWEMLRDKLHFTLLTLLGPDLVFLLAFTQLQSARTSVAKFKRDGYPDWTLRHAFYADMGGIAVKPPDWKQFPVNSSQLNYLIKHGYMKYPSIPVSEIETRSKTDGLGRTLTIGQTLYFTVTTLTRITQGLPITTLELTVLGFVLCTIATSLCWWYKPNDVETGHVFDLDKGIESILREAGDVANGMYRDNPLDFVCCERWAGSVLWPFYVNILRRLKLFPDRHRSRPLQKLSSFYMPSLPRQLTSELLVTWISLAYLAVFFAAWNFYFPTGTERLLWRLFTTLQCIVFAVTGLVELVFPTWSLETNSNGKEPADSVIENGGHLKQKRPRPWIREVWSKSFNNSIGKHPYYDVPLRSVVITTPLCAAYCICRWYLLLEDLLGLRTVPKSIYQAVDWTRYWPSF